MAEELRPFFCLDLSYAHTLLTKGFKIPDDAQITLVSPPPLAWLRCSPSALAAASLVSESPINAQITPVGLVWGPLHPPALPVLLCSHARAAAHAAPTPAAPARATLPANPCCFPHTLLCLSLAPLQVKRVEYNGDLVEAAWPLGAALNALG